jgi:urease subunit alpha
MPYEMERDRYARLYGPTAGDRIRLGDTNLVARVERSLIPPGSEVLIGAGRNLRDGMMIAGPLPGRESQLDMVITNAVVMDPVLGIVKADVGVKDGVIVGVGNAGNPDLADGIDLLIDTNTTVIQANGLIATPGALDVHVHMLTPQQIPEALCAGITTLIGGSAGPVFDVGIGARYFLDHMIAAYAHSPVNVGFLTRASSDLDAMAANVEAGAVGMKIHEDLGAYLSVIDASLRVADQYDVQSIIHTDSINEFGHVEDTIAAFAGRTIHAYHIEGAGGGHVPDLLTLAGLPNVLPSSTNPTNPYTVNTLEEHLDMIMTCHLQFPDVPEDVAFADSRIRAETVAGEDVLHDLGAISMMASDSQGMGRIGESPMRAWQLAHRMKEQRGGEGEDDNARILRYLAKCTINPAIAQGIGAYVGSLERGKVADVVLWNPRFFGAKPDLVIKSGMAAWAPLGQGNAVTMFAEPRVYKPMFGGLGGATERLGLLFVSRAALDSGVARRVGTQRRVLPVQNTRRIGKANMLRNDATPHITVDADSYTVRVDGQVATVEPASSLPLTQLYFIG